MLIYDYVDVYFGYKITHLQGTRENTKIHQTINTLQRNNIK